jgi:hypothetical protein
MTDIITHAMVWTADNISSFRGFDINASGDVELSDGEYADYLTGMYGDVDVCGQSFPAGNLLMDADRVSFDSGKGDYESELTDEFNEALENEDESELKFATFEPFEINEEDAEQDDDE